MALIPPDAGVRLRMQTEANLLQPISPVREIPADLPELQLGQAFTARIVDTLPDNMYKALVAGKLLTLQLPEGAKPGDALELLVIDRTARSVVAQRVDGQAAALPGAPGPVPEMLISRAGQLIGRLLSPEGEAPKPAALNGGQPLLGQPPLRGADLAPALAKAVSQSGLFYESHQAQWVAGQRPLESLQAEPHAQLLQAATALASESLRPGSPESTAAAQLSRSTEAATTPAALTIPDPLRPLVQQQLDAIATQRLAWHGEVWPGQTMEFEVERQPVDDREAAAAADQADSWNTTLRLTMPRLGQLDVTLQLAGNQLRLRLRTASETAAGDLRASVAALADGIANTGLALQTIDITRGEA
jgi:hypothetical protein